MVTSSYEEKLYELLKEAFPYSQIRTQYFIKHKGQKLYFDFYIPSHKLMLEFQGSQHYHFVEYFHGDNKGFKEHKERDFLKKEWIYENNMKLLEINDDNFPKDVSELLSKILEVLK